MISWSSGRALDMRLLGKHMTVEIKRPKSYNIMSPQPIVLLDYLRPCLVEFVNHNYVAKGQDM
jgi:hypothetical protein